MEQDLDLMRIHPEYGEFPVDESFALHVHRDLDCGGRRPFPRPGLQKIEGPLLDGELDIPLSFSTASGVRIPATTSSPCAFIRNSPKRRFTPVLGSRVNATPVPDRSPMLPKTIA
jgi:hypothetical protein